MGGCVMTPEQLREAAKVMLAAADGKAIQFRHRGAGAELGWYVGNNPDHRYDFNHYEYRIKPEPRVISVALYEGKEGYLRSYTHMECVPAGWKRVSDYVGIEVKDE